MEGLFYGQTSGFQKGGGTLREQRLRDTVAQIYGIIANACRLGNQQAAAGYFADQAAQMQAALGDRAPGAYRHRAAAAQRLIHRALGGHGQSCIGIVQYGQGFKYGGLIERASMAMAP